MYENQKWIEEARELALSGNTTELREQLRELDPVDIAQLIEELPRRAKAAVFRMLGKEQAAQVFTYLEGEDVQLIASMAGDGELAEMMEFLPVDDAVDLLEEMPAGVVKRILPGGLGGEHHDRRVCGAEGGHDRGRGHCQGAAEM